MAEHPHSYSFDLTDDQPLIAVPIEEDGHQVVRYFTDEDAADQALALRKRRDVRHLACVWKDLDWDAAADELDRLRHLSPPTPPLNVDL